MPSFARELEQTLHTALAEASSRRHEYATLEHLLLALIEDVHASKVMHACGVDLGELREAVRNYLDSELESLQGRRRDRSLADQRLPARRPARDPPRPVFGPRRGDRRQRAGRALLRARKLCGLFPPAAGHEPARCGQLHQPRRRQGRCRDRDSRSEGRRGAAEGRGQEEVRKRAQAVHRQSQREGRGRPRRSADRPRARGRPHRPDPVPPLEEQPALCRRSRRRQDRDRRRPGAQDRRGRRPRSAAAGGDLLARHGRAARRHALSRRFRGAAEGGRHRARKAAARDPVHRRDPHRDRRRRDQRRRDGRVEPAEAGFVGRADPLHRIDHLQGIPQSFREGPRLAAALPEDRRQRADGRGHDQDPRRPALGVRGASPRQLHPRRDQGGGGAAARATSTTASCPTRRST